MCGCTCMCRGRQKQIRKRERWNGREARTQRYLLQIPLVGQKHFDCVSLHSLRHHNSPSFPKNSPSFHSSLLIHWFPKRYLKLLDNHDALVKWLIRQKCNTINHTSLSSEWFFPRKHTFVINRELFQNVCFSTWYHLLFLQCFTFFAPTP